MYGLRLLTNQIDRATWRNTLMYRVNDDVQVGLEYNPLADDLGTLANVRLVRETKSRPAFIVGTSSDRIGTPFGRAYYLTISKDFAPYGIRAAPYVGIMWSEFDKRYRYPLGATIPLAKGWDLRPTFDGHALHTMATYSWQQYSLTGILVRSRDPGFAFTVGF